MKVCVACAEPFESDTWVCPACGSAPPVIGGHPAFAPDLALKGSGFKAEYFAGLAALEERNFWFRSRNRLLVWTMRRYFRNAQSLLEVGCGNGYVLWGMQRALPRLKLAGSEIFSAGLEFAARRVPDVALCQMDATNIPYVDEFDVIGAFDVLEHIAPDEAVLAQMYKAVKPGGGILITVPQHMSLWSQADEEAMHERRYSAREMRQKVERAGFRVVRMTSFVSLLLPLMAAQRRRRRRPTSTYSVQQELAIRGVANWGLERTLSVERGMIKAGMRFPAGGSLLTVARKA